MKLNRRCSTLFHFEVPGGEMAHGDRKAGVLSESLQLGFPEAGAVPV